MILPPAEEKPSFDYFYLCFVALNLKNGFVIPLTQADKLWNEFNNKPIYAILKQLGESAST